MGSDGEVASLLTCSRLRRRTHDGVTAHKGAALVGVGHRDGPGGHRANTDEQVWLEISLTHISNSFTFTRPQTLLYQTVLELCPNVNDRPAV